VASILRIDEKHKSKEKELFEAENKKHVTHGPTSVASILRIDEKHKSKEKELFEAENKKHVTHGPTSVCYK